MGTELNALVHPLVVERAGAKPNADRLLSELSHFGDCTIARLAPRRQRPPAVQVSVQLPFSGDLVREVTQYGASVTEAAGRCLLGALIEFARHASRGAAALDAYRAEFSA